MTLFRSSFAIGLILALAACVTPDKPTTHDYQGMVPLKESDVGESRLFASRPRGAEYRTYTSLPSFMMRGIEVVNVRLSVGMDGKVKRASYMEGSRSIWLYYQTSFKYWAYDVSPDALPGPWELDIEITCDATKNNAMPQYSTKHISYRSLGAA